MIGMNTIFHVVAGISFVALGFGLLRLQLQRDLLRQALESVAVRERQRVHNVWPQVFLRQYATALGIPFESTIRKVRSTPPRQIDLRALVELFLTTEVSLVRCKDDPKESGQVFEFVVAKPTAVEGQLLRRLSETFDVGTTVKITAKNHNQMNS